jgi:ferredoxin-thioredoxin reductase catalytic subunit
MDKKTQKLIEEYEEYAKKNGIFLNPDKVFVENLVKRLLANEEITRQGHCLCNLFVKN